jgi:energy-converting hydrogenase B subunit E
MDVQAASFLTAGVLAFVGIYAILLVDNIIKKIIGVLFLTDGVNLLFIALGFREGGVVPIIGEGVDVAVFAGKSAYPLSHALVLTNIVIGAATCAFMLALTVRLYKDKHSLSAEKVLGGDGV